MVRVANFALAIVCIAACSPEGSGTSPADAAADASPDAPTDGGPDAPHPEAGGSCTSPGGDCGSDAECCGGSCQQGTCTAADGGGSACGLAGQTCCEGDRCTETLTCEGTTCVPCGASDQPCCDADTCEQGLECLGDQCTQASSSCSGETCRTCAVAGSCGWCDDGSGCQSSQGSCPSNQWFATEAACPAGECADFDDPCTQDAECCHGRCSVGDTCVCSIRNQPCDEQEDCCQPLVCFEGTCGSI